MSLMGQTAVDAAFQTFGVDADYLPQGGGSVTIRVLPRRGDSLLDLGETQIALDSLFFEARVAELPAPQENDLIEVDGQTYLIQAEPRIEDVDGLVWILDTRKT